MQKHHKYMVWTIWVAAIGFIGAGSVGWGSLHFGSKASAIAKVGDIEITQQELNQAYSNLYAKYAQMFQGNFDEKKAKELGLIRQAFSTVEIQTKLLNFAKQNGIIVTNKEVAQTISKIEAFQANGVFDKKAYNTFLTNKRMKAKEFEHSLKNDLTIQKTLNLLQVKPLALEVETVASSMSISDKIDYKIITNNDVNVTVEEDKLKQYWEENKQAFKTVTTYELAIIWKEPSDINSTDSELKAYYDTNSFNFTDNNGKLLSFDEAKTQIKQELALKATKKSAQLDYIALKKGKIAQPATIKLQINDTTLTPKVWQEIADKNKGDIVKPKIVNGKYAIIKIVDINQPRIKTFEEAKSDITVQYKVKLQKDSMLTKAENMVEKLQENNPIKTDFVKIDTIDKLEGLNKQESLHFLQNLFISNKQKGIITLSEQKIVVYNIVDQKIEKADDNMTKIINPIVNKLKSDIYQSNLVEQLNAKYQTEVYAKGLLK
jgi:peptidyl-prolyl cis-trans isomerase D